MPLVAAMCTQCGAVLKVDPQKEAAVCEHCGAAFITEKAINNYNNTYITNNTVQYNISGSDVHIDSRETPEQMYERFNRLCDRHEYKKARKCADELLEKYPSSIYVDRANYRLDPSYSNICKMREKDEEYYNECMKKYEDGANDLASKSFPGRKFTGGLYEFKRAFYQFKKIFEERYSEFDLQKANREIEEYKTYYISGLKTFDDALAKAKRCMPTRAEADEDRDYLRAIADWLFEWNCRPDRKNGWKG